MLTENREHIRIDLDQFKLHVNIERRIELSLHFDSPSRRFYLSLIALVVNEMKRLKRVTSIPVKEHHAVLALLNETVGGSAGSSNQEYLFPRIYRKWKGALPDLENGPLFRVLGKKKVYGDGIEKIYQYSEEEKDSWANLFEYKGSGANVRLRFSVDRIGVGIDDVVITYGERSNLRDARAWDQYIENLRQSVRDEAKLASYSLEELESKIQISELVKRKPLKWIALAIMVALVTSATLTAIWKLYSPASPSIEPAFVEKMTYPLPDKPSIAVLPFDNLSDDPEDEYIADGITENIITTLSKIDAMFVIARNSTYTYKGRPVKINQVSEELGVQYVLEGSYQRFGDQMRITAQLNDALSGHHVWADQYDRNMKDFFDVIDEITKEIVTELHVELTSGEQMHMFAEETNNLQAWTYFVKGVTLLSNWMKRENNIKAREQFEKAVSIDPNFVSAWGWLAETYYNEIVIGWSKNNTESLHKMNNLLQKAVSIDASSAATHAFLGVMHHRSGQYEKAISEGERAVALDPNNAFFLYLLSRQMHYADRPQEAVSLTRRAMRLCPIYPAGYLIALGRSCHSAGLYEKALEAYEQLFERNKKGELDPLWTHLGFTATYLELGRLDKARDHFAEVLKSDPNFQFFGWARAHLCYRDLEYLRRLIDPLRPATGTAARERKLFLHTGVPKFKLEYPQGSKKLSSTSPYVPLWMRTLSKEDFYVVVTNIPYGRELSEIGTKVFLSRFVKLGIGSNFEVISNEGFTLKDGTQAYRTEINWLYGDGNTWQTTLLVSAFKDGKRVSVIVHTYGDPAEVAWIAESLIFE